MRAGSEYAFRMAPVPYLLIITSTRTLAGYGKCPLEIDMQTPGYFFIVGYPRSGTTLLSVLLDRHTRLCVPPETAFFDEVAPSLILRSNVILMRVLGNWKRLGELNLEPKMVRQRLGKGHSDPGEVLAAILDLYALSRGKVRCGEK